MHPLASDCTDVLATPWNDLGGSDVAFFDRHDLSCPASSAMSRFQLEDRRNPDQMRFAYTCEAPVPVTTDTVSLDTDSITVGNIRSFYQFAHPVACPDNRPALQRWHFHKNGAKKGGGRGGGGGFVKAGISYTCAAVVNGVTCVERSTDISVVSGSNAYLDRHNVKCGC